MTHNVHGPHDGDFYKFLGELEAEYKKLRDTGYSGEGFFGNGKRLGTGTSHNLPPHLARAKAVQAAEKRQNLQIVLGGSARKLGGKLPKDLSPRELAAQVCWFFVKQASINYIIRPQSEGQGTIGFVDVAMMRKCRGRPTMP